LAEILALEGIPESVNFCFLIHAASMGAAGKGLSNDLRERVVEAVVLGGLSRAIRRPRISK
jgi:hypothetical protein